MSYKVFLHPKAARFLEKADAPGSDRIRQGLRELENSPEKKGEHLTRSPFWRLKVGDYRAIYEIDNERNAVIVLFIGHRRDVYDDFSHLLD